ncbi:MAG TPA: hypothetical protein PLK94_05230 [Alphaproteobacteria bacterium]|nr:hypothetical protein [Alphaproteobacteria bacterium]HOO50677.1 hypothetical protein [Alphaproteobacteria bacterium]
MFGISKKASFFTYFFGFLTLAAFARDLYAWNRDKIYPRGDFGAILRQHWPEYYRPFVDFVGDDIYEKILTPIFSIPAVLIFLTLTILSFGIGYLRYRFSAAYVSKAKMKEAEKKSQNGRSFKDRVKYKRQ